MAQEALTEASIHPSVPPAQQRRPLAVLRALVVEVVLLGVMFAVYELGRHLADAESDEAIVHAHRVWHLERLLALPSELSIQHWVLAQADDVARLANLYYVGVHFPATFAVLAWLFVWHRGQYLRVRTELILSTAIALLIHMNYPLAPPRLVPEFGIVDTMVTVGPSAYPESTTSGFANQFAAMPSLHVGWAVLVAIAVIRVYRSRWRWAALLYPTATWSVVVITGNHYILDGIIGSLIVIVAVAACGLVPRWRGGRYPVPATRTTAPVPATALALLTDPLIRAAGRLGPLSSLAPQRPETHPVGVPGAEAAGLDVKLPASRPASRHSGDELQDARSH